MLNGQQKLVRHSLDRLMLCLWSIGYVRAKAYVLKGRRAQRLHGSNVQKPEDQRVCWRAARDLALTSVCSVDAGSAVRHSFRSEVDENTWASKTWHGLGYGPVSLAAMILPCGGIASESTSVQHVSIED